MKVIKPYSTYKDSGIARLGVIPKHWGIVKITGVSELLRGNSTFKKDELLNSGKYVALQYGKTYKVNEVDEKFNFYVNDEFYKESQIVNHGNIIFISTSETIEDLGHSVFYNRNDLGLLGGEQILLKPKNNVNGKYLYYSTKEFAKELKKYATGVKVYRFNVNDLKTIYTSIPPLSEQTAIANFLDYKTAKIDRFIFKKKQLIKLLNEQKAAIINDAVTKGLNPKAKMKSSGIEWLGDIPEHWEVRKLKGICKAYGRIGFRGYKTTDLVNQGEGAITISPSNMKYDYMTFEKCTFLSWSKYEESPEIKIYNDDLIMVKTGSTFGKVGIVKDLEQKATINPQLLVLKSVKVNPNYLYLLLKSNLIQSQVKTEVIGSTIPTISQTKILNFKLIIPPDEEIEHLLKGIEKETAIITKTISTIEKEIALVQEYRTALIAEAVTGKIDVREYNVPSFEEDKEYAEMEEEMGLVAEDGEEMGIEN